MNNALVGLGTVMKHSCGDGDALTVENVVYLISHAVFRISADDGEYLCISMAVKIAEKDDVFEKGVTKKQLSVLFAYPYFAFVMHT